jgi:fused signal recognition particle receptor
MEDLEEILYTSDLGPQTVQRLLQAVETRLKVNGGSGLEAVRLALKDEMLDIFDANGPSAPPVMSSVSTVPNGYDHGEQSLHTLSIWGRKPSVLMVVGVNGAGKTTTIGKLASRLAQEGQKVLVAAGDTFRAAAGGQLKIWTERAQVEIFNPENVTDPSAVAFMATERAKAEAFDVVIIDTAGRLHTQKNLMEELKKMKRVIAKVIPDAPHEVLLVLDSNSGQNALIQAREFHQALNVTGVVLTKLDGTAKGGVAVGLACELQLPIRLIGVGEGINDLRSFSSREFVDSIL